MDIQFPIKAEIRGVGSFKPPVKEPTKEQEKNDK